MLIEKIKNLKNIFLILFKLKQTLYYITKHTLKNKIKKYYKIFLKKK